MFEFSARLTQKTQYYSDLVALKEASMLYYLSTSNRTVGLHMAYHLYPTASILFTSIYRPREQVGCTPSGVEKNS